MRKKGRSGGRTCQSSRVTAIDRQRACSALFSGRATVGNFKIMIIDRKIAEADDRSGGALPGLRSALLDRRSFLFGSAVGLGALGLAGCASSDGLLRAEAAKIYGPAPDEKFPIPAVDVSKIDPKYFRQIVRYESDEAPGTLIIDPSKYYLYRIEGDGNATRYGANVSRPEFLWSGDAYVGRKAEWRRPSPPRRGANRPMSRTPRAPARQNRQRSRTRMTCG